MRKLTFFYHIRHLLKNIIKNKVRFRLVILGLMIPAIVLMTAFFVIDSLYYSQFNQYSHYDDYNLVQVELSSTSHAPRAYLQEMLGNQMVSFHKRASGLLFDIETVEQTIHLDYDWIATNQSFSGGLVVDGAYVMPSRLSQGRLFDQDDFVNNHPVAIIDSLTASLVFPDVDPIGKFITIPLYQQTTEGYRVVEVKTLEVIGLVEPSLQQEVAFATNLSSGEDFRYSAQVYTTNSITFTNIIGQDDVRYVFYNTKPVNRMDPFYFNGITSGVVVYDVIYFQAIVHEIQANFQVLKIGFLAGSAILLVLSSISMISILIFAVKERIGEIGVKKAFGATKVHVMRDFLLEGIFVGLFSFVLGFIISVYLVYIGMYLARVLNPNLYYYQVFIESKTIFLAFLMIMISCLIATLIPSRYAATIHINDAIKFE